MQSIQFIPPSILSAAIRGLVIGIALGLIPLILGIFKKKQKLGIYGLISSSIGGAIFTGIFSIIIVPIFIWMILRKPKVEESAAAEIPSENEVSGD